MGSVQLAEPNPDWPRQFNAAAIELRSAMADATCLVEHIGSTAVPGLCAKPVLDLLLGVKELATIEARMTALAMLGYRYRPDYEDQLPQRRYFVRDASAGLPRIHLHGLVADGEHWRAHLAFRDALRNDPALWPAQARAGRTACGRQGGLHGGKGTVHLRSAGGTPIPLTCRRADGLSRRLHAACPACAVSIQRRPPCAASPPTSHC